MSGSTTKNPFLISEFVNLNQVNSLVSISVAPYISAHSSRGLETRKIDCTFSRGI